MTHKPFGQLTDAEKGALLLAHHEGKRIEMRFDDGTWCHVGPHWDPDYVYRIAPEPKTPDSIDWSHVSDEINAIARHQNGNAACFARQPVAGSLSWGGAYVCSASLFTSYRRGTVDWRDSLVIRPGYEGK